MGSGKSAQAVMAVLLIGTIGGLAMLWSRNNYLEDRLSRIEHAAPAKQMAPATVKPSAPTLIELPASDTTALEERIAALERRAGGAQGTTGDPLPAVAATGAARVSPDTKGDATGPAPTVSDDFRKAVLAVLKEKDEAQSQARGKFWIQGMADHQVNDLAERLHLSQTQKEQISKIFREGAEKAMALFAPMWGGGDGAQKFDREQVMQQVQKLTADVDGQAKAYLTTEQAVQYDDWRAQQNQQMGVFGGGRAVIVNPGSRSGPSTTAPAPGK